MGIILALPEFIGAAIAGGAEALEIAGSAGALIDGTAVTTAASIGTTAEVLGESLPVTISEAAATVLAQTPEVVEALNAGGQAVGSAVSLGSGLYQAISSTDPQSGTHGISDRVGMANALVPYQHVPTYIQWLRNILSYIPTIQQIWGGLERATQTYQYLDDQYRLREQQYERLVEQFERGVNSGPVAGVINRIRASALERELEIQRIAGDVRDVSANLRGGLAASGRAINNVASTLYNTMSGAASATRAAAGSVGGTVSNVVGHVQGTISSIQDYLRTIGSEASGVTTTMLTDGYNAMPRGISNFGSWIFMSGSDGGTPPLLFGLLGCVCFRRGLETSLFYTECAGREHLRR
uniref:VP2 n=2 Tax=Bank vole polyomavirus TaxID=1737522 RepID=A0A0P0I7I4_9POLY|nr:VP2 [Bank vole polyomavirus]